MRRENQEIADFQETELLHHISRYTSVVSWSLSWAVCLLTRFHRLILFTSTCMRPKEAAPSSQIAMSSVPEVSSEGWEVGPTRVSYSLLGQLTWILGCKTWHIETIYGTVWYCRDKGIDKNEPGDFVTSAFFMISELSIGSSVMGRPIAWEREQVEQLLEGFLDPRLGSNIHRFHPLATADLSHRTHLHAGESGKFCLPMSQGVKEIELSLPRGPILVGQEGSGQKNSAGKLSQRCLLFWNDCLSGFSWEWLQQCLGLYRPVWITCFNWMMWFSDSIQEN